MIYSEDELRGAVEAARQTLKEAYEKDMATTSQNGVRLAERFNEPPRAFYDRMLEFARKRVAR